MVSLISPSSFCNTHLHKTCFFSTHLFHPRYHYPNNFSLCSYNNRSIEFQDRYNNNSENNRHKRIIECRVITANAHSPSALTKEAHKYFDQVFITVRAGDGGHGAILNTPNERTTTKEKEKEKEKVRKKKKSGSLKRDFDGSLILPSGGHGGDVVIYADESLDTLLEFHNKNRYSAKRGGNVDGMGSVLTSFLHDGLAAPTLRVPVPLGLYPLLFLNIWI